MPFKSFKRTQQPELVRKSRRQQVYDKSDGRDWYTGQRLDFNNFHIDHMQPRKKGGSNTFGNLFPTDPVTNLRKGARDLEDFREVELRRRRESGGLLAKRHRKHKFWFEKKKLGL